VEIFLPVELEEALLVKEKRSDSVAICGGTDLMVDLNFLRRDLTAVIDLSQVSELGRWGTDGLHFFLGAGVTFTKMMTAVPSMPPLGAAARTIGSPQIRNRGTVGGNLGTASPAGDILPVLAAFDAEIILAAAGGRRRIIAWSEFLVGPRQNCLEPDELIIGVRWYPVRGRGIFSKIGTRNAMVIAIANLCLTLDEDRCEARVAVGSVAPTVIRLVEVESLVGEVLESAGVWSDPSATVDDEGVQQAANLVEDSVDPIDDVRGTAAYRRHACGVLFRRALRWALEDRAGGGGALADPARS
jgi:CO/xanthine dehydrogenase FAD-binding subunit